MYWLASQGATVAIPVSHSPDYDVIADFGDEILRVQVKTSTCWTGRRWAVSLATRGGNQSWSGLVNGSTPSAATPCSYTSATAAAGTSRRRRLGAARGLTLGGPKYAEFEVEPGAPPPVRRKADQAAQS